MPQVNLLDHINDEDNGRIFKAKLSDDKHRLRLYEGCDHYFFVDLTKNQVLELIRKFNDLADQIVEETDDV